MVVHFRYYTCPLLLQQLSCTRERHFCLDAKQCVIYHLFVCLKGNEVNGFYACAEVCVTMALPRKANINARQADYSKIE
jgi:hypothetical protein